MKTVLEITVHDDSFSLKQHRPTGTELLAPVPDINPETLLALKTFAQISPADILIQRPASLTYRKMLRNAGFKETSRDRFLWIAPAHPTPTSTPTKERAKS